MNHIYEFVLESDNGRPRSIHLGEGTLDEGTAIVLALDAQFERLTDRDLEVMPSTDPLSMWEGNEVLAYQDGVRMFHFTDVWEKL